VEPLPYRSVGRLPKPEPDGRGKVVGAWAPVWLPLGVLVGLPVFLSGAAVTLYLIPGRLIAALLS